MKDNKTRILGYAAAALMTVAVLPACEDFLDTVPDDRTEIDSADKVKNILVSAYPSVSPILIQELSSDNVTDNGAQYDIYGQITQDAYLWKDGVTDDTDAPLSIWDAHYNAIASANLALEAIENLGNPASLKPQRGEALICRAYSHFQLANLFCMTYDPATSDSTLGIPYITKPGTSIRDVAERGTLQNVYEMIEKDIEEGLPLISDGSYSVPKYHFNKNAAYAFAARFYLYSLQYEKVIECADVVLGDDPSDKLRGWEAFSNLATDYELRCNAYISADARCNLMLQAVMTSWPYVHGPYGIALRYGNSYDVIMSEIFPGPWGAYNSLYMTSGIWGFQQKYSIPKIIGYFEYTDKTAGIGFLHMVNPVFTTDELALCRAEAYLLRGNPDRDMAMKDINAVMNSMCGKTYEAQALIDFYEQQRTMPTKIKNSDDRCIKKALHPKGIKIPNKNTENLIQCILQLRRVLTVHEGLRWNDIKRYGIEVTHPRSGREDDLLVHDDLRRAIQLPAEVISAGLEANPRNN